MKKREDIVCLNCGNLFHPNKPESKFCCRDCATIYNKEHGIMKKTEEQRAKLSKAHIGKPAWNKGKKTSQEQIEKFKISVAKTWTKEKREEQRLKQKEIWSNQELLQKHSEIAKNLMTSEHKEKISVATKYAMHTEKVKKNIELGKIKSIETKTKNNSFNVSIPEEDIFILLKAKFKEVKRQYRSDSYPFACDFYIPEQDLYIEYQGIWTHGSKPYNELDQECINLVNRWKEKSGIQFYKNAIKVYTISDPLKRKTAKENSLNWIEFFNMKDFMEWYTQI